MAKPTYLIQAKLVGQAGGWISMRSVTQNRTVLFFFAIIVRYYLSGSLLENLLGL